MIEKYYYKGVKSMFKDLNSEIRQHAVFVVERFESGRNGHDIFRVVKFVLKGTDRIGGAIYGRRFGDGPPFEPAGGEAAFDIHYVGGASIFGGHFVKRGSSCLPSASCICKRCSFTFERGDA